MDKRTDWLKAVDAFKNNINAVILCPDCNTAALSVTDIPFDEMNVIKGGERCLECPNCGKIEFVLYRIPPENWLSKQK